MKIAVVGATGFVGRKVVDALLERSTADVLALSRNPLGDRYENNPRFTWNSIDLHNLLECEQALEGCRVAIYLVHSMLPSARLNQGTFQDFDLSLADNFARAAQWAGVHQIIYLSGLMPSTGELSPHLQSRKEVEDVLRFYVPRLTTIRAGLIIGEQGSSFTILYRLVKRLPVMICPRWTKSICQPVFLDDVVRSIIYCIDREECYGRIFDIGGEDRLSYIDMMKKTAALLHKKPHFIILPFFTPKLSRLWVTLVAGAPRSLVYPLIQSLRDNMLVRPDYQLRLPNGPFRGFEETLPVVLERYNERLQRSQSPHAFKRSIQLRKQKSVRSIQRLPLPAGRDAKWAAEQYMLWLPKFFPWFLAVTVKDQMIYFRCKGLPFNLLVLQHSPERSQKDRQLFYIQGGLLSSRKNLRGRLELRETLGGQAILAAVHDFVPALPWLLYQYTQAKIHSFVMARFARFLSQKDISRREPFRSQGG
jgi:uncharacterized protein YbjT (DUF2867 family)